jgi:hypothetical protein
LRIGEAPDRDGQYFHYLAMWIYALSRLGAIIPKYRAKVDKQRILAFKQSGFPGVYESSLKKAWTRFRPVAHLCAAYVTTETHYYEQQLSRDFSEYWKEPPAFYQDEVFEVFCLLAKSVERFATSFLSRGQRQPLISKDEIFALPDEIFEPGITLPSFRALTEEELIALKTYRAPKSFV